MPASPLGQGGFARQAPLLGAGVSAEAASLICAGGMRQKEPREVEGVRSVSETDAVTLAPVSGNPKRERASAVPLAKAEEHTRRECLGAVQAHTGRPKARASYRGTGPGSDGVAVERVDRAWQRRRGGTRAGLHDNTYDKDTEYCEGSQSS